MVKPLNRSLKTSIKKQLSSDKELRSKTRILIEKQFNILKRQLMSEFSNHPVTKELESGSGASNITNTLRNGNIFGFIGFEVGTNPISGIYKLLERTDIFLKQAKMGTFGFVWTYTVTSPSMQELYSATPMPWANGSSWLRELEGRGIPNLGQYMYKKIHSSRSQAGFQNINEPSGGRLRIPYIKKLLQDFEDKLNSIEASRVSAKYFR
jgi:hypothetical protein